MSSLPDDVVAALAGRPTVGEWEPIFPLLTVDDEGFPHVCLLGRAELDADDTHLFAVSGSPATNANIGRTGKATLIVIDRDAATYCTLELVGERIVAGRLVGFRFVVASTKRDTAGVALHAPAFHATAELAESEHWAATAELLSRLRTGGASVPAAAERPSLDKAEEVEHSVR